MMWLAHPRGGSWGSASATLRAGAGELGPSPAGADNSDRPRRGKRANALDLDEHEFISNAEAETTFRNLTALASTYAWRPALRLTAWTPETEGHMICVEPTGKANAWPVYDAKDLFEPLGNVLEEPITEIWKRYRFKRNHVAKYLGASIHTTQRGGGHA